MRTRHAKWLCIAILFMAFAFRRLIANFEFPVRLAACAGGAVAIAFLFLPAITLFPLAGGFALPAVGALSIPSIADRNPGTESL